VDFFSYTKDDNAADISIILLNGIVVTHVQKSTLTDNTRQRQCSETDQTEHTTHNVSITQYEPNNLLM